MDLPQHMQFVFGTPVVDQLPDPAVEDRVQTSALITCPVTPAVERSLSGDNPSADHEHSVGPGATLLKLQRSIDLGLRVSD